MSNRFRVGDVVLVKTFEDQRGIIVEIQLDLWDFPAYWVRTDCGALACHAPDLEVLDGSE